MIHLASTPRLASTLRRTALLASALLAALTLAACNDPGSPGAADANVCQPGLAGCPCAAGDVCATEASGAAMMCEDNLCVSARCSRGDTGCACVGGTRCTSADDECQEGICKPADCRAGELNCDCLAGTCGAGLFCHSGLGGGTCVDDEGYPGGPCLSNRLCHEQSRCDANTLTCVHCEPGSQGCVPFDGGCNPGLLLSANRCLTPNEVPPSAPVCHTPCSADYVVEGEFRECPPNGIMDGCVGLAECRDGSCVLPDNAVPTCTDDTDCPSFQTCLQDGTQRRCYSNCDEANPCSAGYACHDFVCRVPCVVAQSEAQLCPNGYSCESADGTTGHCMPAVESEPSPAEGPHGTLTLTRTHVLLASPDSAVEVGVSTDSPVDETFEIVRVFHRAYDFSGDVVVDTEASSNRMLSPLGFLRIAVGGDPNAESVIVRQGCDTTGTCPRLSFSFDPNGVGDSWARWDGVVELRHPRFGVAQITVAQFLGADGTWVGEATYFASFPDTPNVELLRQAAGRNAKELAAREVQNAIIGAGWAGYRDNGMPGGFDELRALLNTAADGSWQWQSVRDACAAHDPQAAACYLFDDGRGSTGTRTWFTRGQLFDVPTGATQLPISLHLRSAEVPGGGYEMEGVIDSATALHYGGFPSVHMEFEADPMAEGRCLVDSADGISGDCVTFMTDFSADVWTGARSQADGLGACGSDSIRTDMPWLLPDFVADAQPDGNGGAFRSDCRDTLVPFAGEPALNASWAQANPIPDGRRIRRELHFIDGAMINQGSMFLIFEERFETGLREFVTYGYMVLERTENAPTEDDFATQTTASVPAETSPRLRAACTDELVDELMPDDAPTGGLESMSDGELSALADRIVHGSSVAAAEAYPANVVHYLCVDTGTFYGGPLATVDPRRYACPAPHTITGLFAAIDLVQAGLCGLGSPPAEELREPCPEESQVVYFVREGALAISPEQMAAEPCQQDGSCGERLDQWIAGAGSSSSFLLDPAWRCLQGDDAYCNDDRFDPRVGKAFFRQQADAEPSLGAQIEEAFLYRTRFTSDGGRQIGFAPVECGSGAGQTPYCYDAQAIEAIGDRVECLMAIYEEGVTGGAESNRDLLIWEDLRRFLESSFTQFGNGPSFGARPGQIGFERLYAELLVLLGDEAQTQALRSRFDLAGTNGATFLGSEFEVAGMNLTGLAGFEMHSLYQATQYYQIALDRFYRASGPVVQAAIERGDARPLANISVVRPSLATGFLERLIGASTKLTRTWSEIARRYQGFNRPDLARRVLERAYTSAHIESVVLSQYMLEIAATDAQSRDQLIAEIETAKRRYRVALAEMRDIYSSLTDEVSFFGFAPDYVPFPAVDVADGRVSNAFEAVMFTARRRLDTARRFEDEAIQSNRSFEVDAASFQSELVRIQVSHEQRLAQICGSFVGDDGQVYPSIARYRHLSPTTALLEDPCGYVTNGELYAEGVAVAALANERDGLHQRMEHLVARERDEKERVIAQCDHLQSSAEVRQSRQRQIRDLNLGISAMRATVSGLDRAMGHAGIAAQTSSEGLTGAIPTGIYVALAVGHVVATAALEGAVVVQEQRIADVEIAGLATDALLECESLVIESIPNLRQIRRDADMLGFDVQDLTHRFARTSGDVERLLLEAQRLQEEQAEAEQLAINVESARNDPNIRVYRNAAVINADRSFYRALQYAYRATLVYEYYTSQSYADREQLFLTRMVSHGYYNLENYMDELEDAYEFFREQFRTRARRVEVISLRDDVFRVARNGATAPSTVNERVRAFHEELTDPRYLDANGHISVPFRTHLEDVSACTFAHQVDFVEVWFQGTAPDDFLAEAMIWQEGTGVIANQGGEFDYYQLPPALMVTHPFFSANGRHFDPSIYRRYELRERPYVNTAWRFVFDAYGNAENADIDPRALNDILIYVYYTDFTDPERCR